MKKTRVLLVLIAFAFVGILAACGNALEEAVVSLEDSYKTTIGSSSYVVTDDLSLVTSIGDVAVKWASSNEAVIATDGKVVRPNEDTEVVLTATLTSGDNKKEVKFTVTVSAVADADQVAAAKSALEALYADTLADDEYIVSGDLSLPTSVDGSGATIAWSSSDESIIALTGTVTSPSFTKGDQTVTLIATISKGSESDIVTYYAFVEALDETTEELLNRVFETVVVFPANEGVTGDEAWLAAEYDENDVLTSVPFIVEKEFEGTTYTISWSSGNTDVFSIAADEKGYLAATVIRPESGEDDVVVTVTASITVDGKTATRSIEFKVLAFQAPTLVDSIGAIYDVAEGTYIRVEGVTVLQKVGAGIFIFDGSDVMYIYDTAQIYSSVAVGSVYDIQGVFDLYYGGPELISDTGLPLIAEASEAEAANVAGTPTTIADLLLDRTAPNNNNPMIFEYAQLDVKVVVDVQDTNSGSNYNTYLVPVGYEGTSVITNVGTDGKATEYATDDVLLVYYGSPNKDAVTALDGYNITIDVLLYGYRSDRNIWYTYFLGEASDITVNLTDTQAVDKAAEDLPDNFDAVVYEGNSVELPTSLYGASISYASSDAAVINPVTGAVVLPASGQVDVTLTATITKGEVTKDVAIVVTVGVPAISSIADAKALDLGSVIYVQGVVTASEYQNTYFIQDSTAGMAIYTSYGANEAFLQANLGNEVSVLGLLAEHHGLIQISPDSDFLALVSETATMPTAVNVDAIALSDDMLPYQGQLVEMTDLMVTAVDTDNYGNITVTLDRVLGEGSIVMKWDSRVTLSTDAAALLATVSVGSLVDIVNPLAWDNVPYLYFTDTTEVSVGTLTDAKKAQIDAKGIVVDSVVYKAGTITLPTVGSAYDSVITWASDSALIDAATGAVSMPTSEQVKVTLTATVNSNGETVTATFEVGVGTYLFFSEYIEGSSNNKAVEIYNGTGVDVDLSTYTINLYSSSSDRFAASQTITLSGTLAAGDVYVLYNSSSVDDIKNVGDIASSVTWYNGDDALALLKNGEIVDVIGVIGVDPGTNWPVNDGATSEFTLVRAASVYGPTTTFDESEWVVYAQNTFTYLGSHTQD